MFDHFTTLRMEGLKYSPVFFNMINLFVFFSTFCRITLKLKQHARFVDSFLVHSNYFQIFCLVLFICVKQHQNLHMQAYSYCWVECKLRITWFANLNNTIIESIFGDCLGIYNSLNNAKHRCVSSLLKINLFPLSLLHDSTTPGKVNKYRNSRSEFTETVTRCFF